MVANATVLIGRWIIMNVTEDDFDNGTFWNNETLTTKAGVLPSKEAHHFPPDMLGFAAASAFIIALFGASGQ